MRSLTDFPASLPGIMPIKTRAAAILLAYKDGRLPTKKGAKPLNAPKAEAYLARSDEL